MKSYLRNSAIAFLITASLVFASLGAQCDGNKYSPFVKTGVRVLMKGRTIFASSGLSTVRFDPAIKIGNAAVSAFESGAANAAEQLADFIDAFESIAADASLIKDQDKRTLALVGLAVGSEALHELADLMNRNASQQPSMKAMAMRRAGAGGAQRIAAFASKPRWRCRNSINGQYAAMSYCKEHPDTSEVER